MAFTKKENDMFFIALLITVTVIPLVATQNIDCNGKAFHCVNSTHFKICVDLGGGISTTVDDFVIMCPKNTVCKGSNYFECEYIATTTFKPVQKSEVPNDLSVTPLLKNIDLATNSYNNTSENKLFETVVSTIPTSTLEFKDLTSNSALQNISSDFSDSDRLRETTVLEASTANEELTSTTFTKVTLYNIESNDRIKNNSDFKISNITAKDIINALPNSNFSIRFDENSKIGNIGNSSNIFIESPSNYNAINYKDYGIENNEQLLVTKLKNAIFDVNSITNSTDYTTEIAQGNTKYILNGASSENNITLVSYNNISNSNVSFINISNLTETEISVASDQTSNLTNSTADKSSYIIQSKKELSVQNVNNAELAKNNETIIDPIIELSISSITDNVATSELHINKGPSKVLSQRGKAVKYTATDKNTFYDIATITTEAQNLIRAKIDTSAAMSNSNIKNSTSWSIYQTTEGPNMNYTTVDILQNRENSTLNAINIFDNILSTDVQLITTQAYNVTPKTFTTPNINFESQIIQDSTINDSLPLEQSILNLNSIESNNNLANFSLPTIYSLKVKENIITKFITDTSYTMEPPPTLKEVASQSNVLKENSNLNIDIIGIETTESIPKTTYTYKSLKDQNLYPNPTLYQKDFVDSTIQTKSDDSLNFKITIHDGPYTSSMDNIYEITEPTNAKNELPLEVLLRDITAKVDITTTNNYFEEVISVPTNSFISVEKNIKTVESDMSQNLYKGYSKKLNTTQSSFHHSSPDTVTHKTIVLKESSTISPLEISTLPIFDIEPRKNITNAATEMQTVNNNIISQARNINNIIISDAIIVNASSLKINFHDETIIENKNEPVNTSLIYPHVNITEHTDVNIQKLNASIKKLDENINNNHTDMSIAAHSDIVKFKLPDLNMTRDLDVKLYNVTEMGIHIKQNDDVQKLATTNVVEVKNDIGTTQSILNVIGDKQVETENIEKRDQLISNATDQLISSTTEIWNLNYVNTIVNDTIVNFVNNQTPIGISNTKENNIQIAKYLNDTKQMYTNSKDNENSIQIITTDEIYTTRFDIDTTVSIFNDLDITTEVYNSTEYNNLQNIINNTKINDNYTIKMFTHNNSDIIYPTVAEEIVLPNEIIHKDSNKQIQSYSDTLINVTRNLKIDPHSEAKKQTYNNTKLLENSTKRNKDIFANLNINDNIFKGTKEALPLDNFDNTVATIIDIPGHNNNISKKRNLLNNNLDTKLHIPKDNKEIMQTSYTSAMNSNDNINIVNGSNYFNKHISNNSTFTDDTTATVSTIIVSPYANVHKKSNGEIEEMKIKQIDDTLKRDINFNEDNNKNIQMPAKEMELIYNKTVDNDRSLNTSGVRNEYNKPIINKMNITTNITVLNNTDNIANILSRNNGIYLKDNAIKVQEPYEINDMTTTKVTLTLSDLSVTNIPEETTRNESMNIENIKTNQKTLHGTPEIKNMSVIHKPALDIFNFNYSNMNLKSYNKGVKEENNDTNYKNVSADQMVQHINEKIRAGNLSRPTKLLASTITKNIPTLPSFSSQVNLQNINVNDTYNKNRDSNVSSRNINLTNNLESLNKAVTNNSVTPKNVLNILFHATQRPKTNIITNYVHMTNSPLKYNLEPQQNSFAIRQSDYHLFPAGSKTISTTTNIIRDYLLYAEKTTSLKKDKTNISETIKYDFTTLPYEENNKVTHSMKDIKNIEENQKVTGSITSSVGNITYNNRQIAATEPIDTLTPIACNITSHGRYPDENDCNKFYICIGKQSPIIGKCPVGTVFSDIKKQCTKKLSHCIRNNQFKCLAEGRFIDVLSNNYYYICAKNKNGFVRFKLKCQIGYYLNSNNVRCLLKETSYEDDSKNTSEIRTIESTSSERLQFKPSFDCVEEGKFEFPEHCRKYYVCTKKSSEFRRRVKQCESDEVFDRDKKKCVDEESYECSL